MAKRQYAAKASTWKKAQTTKIKANLLKKIKRTLNRNPNAKVTVVSVKLETKKTAGKKAASLNRTIRKQAIRKATGRGR